MINAKEAKEKSIEIKVIKEINNKNVRISSKLEKEKYAFEYINVNFQAKLVAVNEAIEDAVKLGESYLDYSFGIFDDKDKAVAIMVINAIKEKGFMIEANISLYNSNTVEEPIEATCLNTKITW